MKLEGSPSNNTDLSGNYQPRRSVNLSPSPPQIATRKKQQTNNLPNSLAAHALARLPPLPSEPRSPHSHPSYSSPPPPLLDAQFTQPQRESMATALHSTAQPLAVPRGGELSAHTTLPPIAALNEYQNSAADRRAERHNLHFHTRQQRASMTQDQRQSASKPHAEEYTYARPTATAGAHDEPRLFPSSTSSSSPPPPPPLTYRLDPQGPPSEDGRGIHDGRGNFKRARNTAATSHPCRSSDERLQVSGEFRLGTQNDANNDQSVPLAYNVNSDHRRPNFAVRKAHLINGSADAKFDEEGNVYEGNNLVNNSPLAAASGHRASPREAEIGPYPVPDHDHHHRHHHHPLTLRTHELERDSSPRNANQSPSHYAARRHHSPTFSAPPYGSQASPPLPRSAGDHFDSSPPRRPQLPSIRMMSQPPHSAPPIDTAGLRAKERGTFDVSPQSMSDAHSHQQQYPEQHQNHQYQQHHQQSNRSSAFMASLLRAAHSPDSQSPSTHSPMSVHSIVEGRGQSPSSHRRPRKRRTSSVQEPLQGSALEAATRAQGFPRLSEPASQRMHADEAYTRHHASYSLPPQSTARFGTHSGVSPHPAFEAASPVVTSGQRWRAAERPSAYHGHAAAYASPSTPHSTFSRYEEPSYATAPRHATHVYHTPSYGSHGNHSHSSSTAYPVSVPPVAAVQHAYTPNDHHARSSSGHYGYAATASTSAAMPLKTGTAGQPSMTESSHWNAEFASRARAEQDRWSRSSMHDRRRQVTLSIWDARAQLESSLSYWPPPASNITTIRCMYANIAQKSYGSEKRFLCPPPVVKINGPLRPCKWVTMRVTLGESAAMHGAAQNVGSSSAVGVVAGGEEPALLDAQGEARFGKLHVGSVSEATSKVFRLQVNLLRAELTSEDVKNGGGLRAFQDIDGPLQLPSYAWATFHSSPINVISKPARKSVRTRAASPAIASGSTVCLYNRLNSQTVRTKYLGVESGSVEDVAHTEVARKMVARQDGWEGFSIELLARPLHDPATVRASSRGMLSDERGITYGSIVCLRDVNSKLCSDPMLICKVDKGRVELSSVIGNDAKQNSVVRFQIASKNRKEAQQILFGGARQAKLGNLSTFTPHTNASHADAYNNSSNSEQARYPAGSAMHADSSDPAIGPSRREGSESSGAASPSGTSNMHSMGNAATSSSSNAAPDAINMLGGPVIQMQKVTLMHITPMPSRHSPDEIECDLSTPRAYLCSTASENARDDPSQPALARSQARMLSRSTAVQQGALQLPLDEPDVPSAESGKANTVGQSPLSSSINTESAAAQAFLQAQSASVGFSHPPAVVYDSMGSGGQVDVLEDQFCWTIVTISCTEVSYIEANASSASAGRQKYPHLPLSSLPVTPFPCLAAQPSYDGRTHSLAATVHDYLYADGLDPVRFINTVSAVHPVSSKAAHEVWLAHSGPLAARASSAGPYMSDVTVSLPSMEHMVTLHADFHEQSMLQRDTITRIRLPILFVRVSQGLTFPSGHWLLAERIAGSMRDPRDALAWSFQIV